jgi:hypothetical protein
MLAGEPPRGPEEGVPDPVLPDPDASLSDTELVCDIWAGESRACRDYALRAEAIAALARRRRSEADAAFGPRGGPGVDARAWQNRALVAVSEAFVPELALILSCTESEAESAAVEAVLLTTKLRGTWSALFEGRISVRKMQAPVDLLGPATAETCAAVEARLLPRAADWTVPQLRAAVRRHLCGWRARPSRRAAPRRRSGPTCAPIRPATAGASSSPT